MRRSSDRILTTHVGSLIRPAALLEHAARQQPQQLPRYQEAVRRNPNYISSHRMLAATYAELGREFGCAQPAAAFRQLTEV